MTFRLASLTTRFLACCAFLLFAAAPAGAEPERGRAYMVEHVVVKGDLVTLTDLFRNIDPAINKPVFRAPDPGTTGKVSTARVLEAAQKYNIEAVPPAGARQIKVTRASRVIRVSDLQARVREELEHRAVALHEGTLVIEMSAHKQAYHLPSQNTEQPQLTRFDWSPRSGLFRATFRVSGLQPIHLRGKAMLMIDIVAPNRNINRGEVISAADLQSTRLAARYMRDNYLRSAEDIVGQAAKRRLRSGQPVRKKDIEAPLLIRRNQLVTILLETPGMILRAEGKALADAGEGASVKVMNTHSKRIVNATAKGMGLVIVSPSAKNGGSGS